MGGVPADSGQTSPETRSTSIQTPSQAPPDSVEEEQKTGPDLRSEGGPRDGLDGPGLRPPSRDCHRRYWSRLKPTKGGSEVKTQEDDERNGAREKSREPFAATSTVYSWRSEFSRLNRLYGARVVAEELLDEEDAYGPVSAEGGGDAKKRDESFRRTSVKLSLGFQPSDPDFPFSKLREYNLQDSGTDSSSSSEKFPVLLYITVPAGYPRENIDQVVLDAPEYQYVSSKFNGAFKEAISKMSSALYPIYEALKMFDRGFPELIRSCLPSVESIHEYILLSWTPGEQKLLEEAICYYKYTKDVNKKWREIANHVGNGKTVKQCIDRYKYCRSLVAGKQPERRPTKSEEGEEGKGGNHGRGKTSASDVRTANDALGSEEGTVLLQDFGRLSLTSFESLLVNGLEIFSIDLVFIAVLRVQVYCSRCNEVNDYRPISIPGNQDLASSSQEEARELSFLDNLVLGNSQNCRKCSLKHSIHFSPLICHSNDVRIGKVEFSECSLRDILPLDILVSCSNCSNFLKIREFFVGKQYSVSCRNCFKELKIRVSGFSVGDEVFNVDKSTDFLLTELSGLKRLKKRTNKDSKLPTAVGTPLPANGTCSHYKKSNRWSRFPCCNKAYPCHECHDKDNHDHKFEWAKQMICGFCSREQGFSDNCKYCRTNLIGKTGNTSGRFWEGGKGCRNPLTLSNRDSRKHKLISRQLKKT